MRVDYTLPALQPAALPEATGAGAAVAPAFRDQLRGTRVQVPEGWEHALRLDARPFSATAIGPPPRPHTLELGDAESQRTQWQGLVLRHSDAQGQNSQASNRAISHMLNLLQE